MKPAWFSNTIALADWSDAQSAMAMLTFSAPFVNQYLNVTHVASSTDAQAVVRVLHRLYARFADFSKIMLAPDDSAEFREFIAAYRRVRGLAGAK